MKSEAYRTHPVHELTWLSIQSDYTSLARDLVKRVESVENPAIIVIDGFLGVQWEEFSSLLQASLAKADFSVKWQSTSSCFLPEHEIDTLIAPFLTEDPVFGRLFYGHLEEMWCEDSVAALRNEIASRSAPTIVYGFGASCITGGDVKVYLDVPKDRGQQLAAQGLVCNVGASGSEPLGSMYKRSYFVDWPMLNRIKRNILPELDIFIDATHNDSPVFVDGESFRSGMGEVAREPFRVKPWFAPGPWGGQWMKEQFKLPKDQPNYAWSFELIAPENGLLIGNGASTLEVSFDCLLWTHTEDILGTSVAARYGSYFPIRFDYLDTIGGTNLSCQVHPRLDYMRDEFGEPFTQDETYYIVRSQPDSRVFLGFREDADLADFKKSAIEARDSHTPFEIESYVNSIPSTEHDLFLIPSGTIHCSGAGNLVLEISATPYIYTFKIYDYLREDLSGNVRHVSLDHAFNNLDRTRRAEWVEDNLCPKPQAVREGSDWAELCIGDSDLMFFAVHRLEFESTIEDETNSKFVALNLVEGERCQIVTEQNRSIELRFAETLVVPASVGHYTLHNMGETPCKVVKAFVKG